MSPSGTKGVSGHFCERLQHLCLQGVPWESNRSRWQPNPPPVPCPPGCQRDGAQVWVRKCPGRAGPTAPHSRTSRGTAQLLLRDPAGPGAAGHGGGTAAGSGAEGRDAGAAVPVPSPAGGRRHLPAAPGQRPPLPAGIFRRSPAPLRLLSAGWKARGLPLRAAHCCRGKSLL